MFFFFFFCGGHEEWMEVDGGYNGENGTQTFI